MIELKSIREEAADCRARFRGIEVGSWVMFCHHDVVIEQLTEPPENRIRYILSEKPTAQQPLRLHLFRPIPKEAVDDYNAKRKPLYDDYNAKRKPLYEDYDAKRKLLRDDYDAKLKPLDGEMISRFAPGAPWDGNTIFCGGQL